MLRRSFVSVCLLVACVALAGCTGGDETETKPTPTASPSETPRTVQLKLEVYGDDAAVATYQQIADAYTAANPDVTFQVTATSDAGEAAEAAIGAIQSGTSAPDVFLLDVDHLAQAVEADVLQPVDELLEERGVPFGDGVQRVGLTAYSVNNALACMPAEVSPRVVFYNRKLVKPRQLAEDPEKPAPFDRSWRWDDFLAAADMAASKGAKGTYLPPDLRELAPLILSGGGKLVDDAREPTQLELSDDGTRDALKKLAVVTRDPRLSLTPADVKSKPAIEWFKEGELGLLFGTKAMVPSLRQVPGLRFDVLPTPRIDDAAATSVMNGYCISKESEHIDAAADFVAFATTGDGVALASASGWAVPSSLDALHSDEFLQPGQRPRNEALFGEAARKSLPTAYSPAWVSAARTADDIIERVLYGTTIDVTSEETPELDELLEATDEASKETFNPPEPTESPSLD